MQKPSLALGSSLFAAALLIAGTASAQITPERREVLKALRTAVQNMPPGERASLSSGIRAVLTYAAQVDGGLIPTRPPQNSSSQGTLFPPSQFPVPVNSSPGPGGTIRISNPEFGLAGSVFAGFSENTTSSARCGNSVVVGYEETAALLATFGADIEAVAYSTDGGNTFLNLLLNPGTQPGNILSGEAKIACSSSNLFYDASVVFSSSSPGALESISLSTSSDGGRNWGPPVPVVSTNICCDFVDQPSLAIDPANPLRMYISFSSFTLSSTTDGFNIQLISSNDGGKTWSAPVVLEQLELACADFFNASFPVADGSNVVVGPGGEVYAAWEVSPAQPCNTFTNASPPREIHFAHSLDHGAIFSAPSKIAELIGNGDATGPFLAGGPTSVMEGGFLGNEFPRLAVDRSNGPSRGTLYATWSDGKNNVRTDVLALSGQYAYPDTVFVKSTDKGLTFTAPVSVSPQPAGFTGRGRDQFFPGIAVDPTGKVAICYYDRRNDPTNMPIDRYCSVSINHGATWQDLRASSPSWVPNLSDFLTSPRIFAGGSIGEYDTLASDFLQLNLGFFGSFVIEEDGNPNIVARKF